MHERDYQAMRLREAVVLFVRACGLRRTILARLHVKDIKQDEETRQVWITINDPDGVPISVPVIAGSEQAVLSIVKGRDPEELVFPQLPQPLSFERSRMAYARALYLQICSSNERGYQRKEIIHYVMHALCEPHRSRVVRCWCLGRSTKQRHRHRS